MGLFSKKSPKKALGTYSSAEQGAFGQVRAMLAQMAEQIEKSTPADVMASAKITTGLNTDEEIHAFFLLSSFLQSGGSLTAPLAAEMLQWFYNLSESRCAAVYNAATKAR